MTLPHSTHYNTGRTKTSFSSPTLAMQTSNWGNKRDAWDEKTRLEILLNRIHAKYNEEYRWVTARNMSATTHDTLGVRTSVLQGGSQWRR